MDKKNMEKMETMPAVFLNDPVFRKLGKVARVAALDKKARWEYEQSLKIYRDNYAIMTTERSEGFAEGEAKGRAEGRAEGERSATISLAHKMIDSGMPLHEVLKLTGLSEESLQ